MKYKLVIQPPALDDLEDAYLWGRKSSPEAAERWFDGLVVALETLKQFPERCDFAPENDHFDEEIRQLLHGRRGGVYRILFTVSENEVRVLHIRHAARKPLDPDI